MNVRIAAVLVGLGAAIVPVSASEPSLVRPKAGKVDILPESQIKPGMKATAWTVFQGTEPEPVPIEIVGVMKNQWGPKQDIILVQLLGEKAEHSGVVAGMSGSPVYFDGKLAGALAFRIGEFSKEPIAGVTPIAEMMEISALDRTPIADSASVKAADQQR